MLRNQDAMFHWRDNEDIISNINSISSHTMNIYHQHENILLDDNIIWREVGDIGPNEMNIRSGHSHISNGKEALQRSWKALRRKGKNISSSLKALQRSWKAWGRIWEPIGRKDGYLSNT